VSSRVRTSFENVWTALVILFDEMSSN
jgi:hypothetical protein